VRSTNEFESIFAICRDANTIDIYLNGDPEDVFDFTYDNCLIWCRINFYGISSDLSYKKKDKIIEGDIEGVPKVGELIGWLILSKQMLHMNQDPLEVCDAKDQDLEYIYSALSDEEGPLGDGDLYQDVFYIHELQMEPEYEDTCIKGIILDELSNLVFTFLHVEPDIIAYYPAPLEYKPDPAKEKQYKILQRIASEKVGNALEPTLNKKAKHGGDKILSFADRYQFSEDEIKLVMGRRHSGSSYPEEAKNQDEYKFYQKHGFKECGDSRVLYKYASLRIST
jgi:hypothetical protein